MHTPLPRSARVVLTFDALVFLGLGLWLTVDPAGALAGLQVAPTGPLGLAELRAMYGGLELGFGLFCLHATRHVGWVAPALWVNVYVLAGLGLVRAHGILLGDAAAPVMLLFLTTEVGAVLLNAWALRTLARARVTPAHPAGGTGPA
jgi:hypothetical protein